MPRLFVVYTSTKQNIDWNTASRLGEENQDFLNYIKLIRQFHQTGEIRAADWNFTDSRWLRCNVQ